MKKCEQKVNDSEQKVKGVGGCRVAEECEVAEAGGGWKAWWRVVGEVEVVGDAGVWEGGERLRFLLHFMVEVVIIIIMKKERECRCKRCGWEWVARVEAPVQCPRCHSPLWRKDRVRGVVKR